MYFILFLLIVITIYIASFKDSFRSENLEKITPVLSVVAVLVILIAVLSVVF